MTRLHCPTCTCDLEVAVEPDLSAPFLPLVLLADAAAHHDMVTRATATKAHRSGQEGKPVQPFDRRLAWLILDRPHFTADDLTDDGDVTLDAEHAPNGAQNGIGAYVNRAARRRLIAWTGAVVRSRAPHRKGGAIRVWTGTDAGRLWARGVLALVEVEGRDRP